MAEKKVRLLDRDPRYPEAKRRLVELQLKRGELQAKIQEILAKPKQTSSLEEEADELLKSGALELQGRQARDDEELGRIRAKVNRLSGKCTNDGGSERNWVAGRNLPPMRFAPRV